MFYNAICRVLQFKRPCPAIQQKPFCIKTGFNDLLCGHKKRSKKPAEMLKQPSCGVKHCTLCTHLSNFKGFQQAMAHLFLHISHAFAQHFFLKHKSGPRVLKAISLTNKTFFNTRQNLHHNACPPISCHPTHNATIPGKLSPSRIHPQTKTSGHLLRTLPPLNVKPKPYQFFRLTAKVLYKNRY